MDISNNFVYNDISNNRPVIERYINNIMNHYNENIMIYQQNINYGLRHPGSYNQDSNNQYNEIISGYSQCIRHSIDVLNSQMISNRIGDRYRNDYPDNLHNNIPNYNSGSRSDRIVSNPVISRRVSTIHNYNSYNVDNIASELINQFRNGADVLLTNMEDVTVTPSSQEIELATETILFFTNNPDNVQISCPITLEPFTNSEEICRLKGCRHLFKRNAIMGWFQRNVRCPVCRHDIRDYTDPLESDPLETDPLESDPLETDPLIQNNIHSTSQIPITNTRRPLTSSRGVINNLGNLLQTFIMNEINNSSLDSTLSEILYTFDIPANYDISMNRVA